MLYALNMIFAEFNMWYVSNMICIRYVDVSKCALIVIVAKFDVFKGAFLIELGVP